MFNKESTIINFLENHEDKRGNILSMVNEPCTNVSIIKSKKGVLRGNHYHKKDWHFMYAIKGYMEYFFYCNVQKKVKFWSIPPNKIIFTPSMEVHATFFPVDSEIIVVSGYARDQESYEHDTVRVSFIDENNLLLAKKGNLDWTIKIK